LAQAADDLQRNFEGDEVPEPRQFNRELPSSLSASLSDSDSDSDSDSGSRRSRLLLPLPILQRRVAAPAFERAYERGALGEAEQERDVLDAEPAVAQVVNRAAVAGLL